jgi:hypothetical protein
MLWSPLCTGWRNAFRGIYRYGCHALSPASSSVHLFSQFANSALTMVHLEPGSKLLAHTRSVTGPSEQAAPRNISNATETPLCVRVLDLALSKQQKMCSKSLGHLLCVAACRCRRLRACHGELPVLVSLWREMSREGRRDFTWQWLGVCVGD